MATLGREREKEERPVGWGPALASFLPPLLNMLAVLLAVAAHVLISGRRDVSWGWLLMGGGVVMALLSSLTQGTTAETEAAARGGGKDIRLPLIRSDLLRAALVINSVILAVVAYSAFGEYRFDHGFWFWMAALCYFVAAFAERPAPGWRRALHRWKQGVNWRVAAIGAAIVALAAFFRLFQLAAVPAEMTSDHAEKLLDVYDVLQGLRPTFFPRNTGREAMQFYLTAALIQWTPLEISHLALKVGTALVGIVTVPATYFLGKALYGRHAGLFAAFLLSVSHWHVTISRIGLRFPFTAAFAAPALYFLFRALRHNRRNDWLAAGGLLGAGLHTYTAMRIVPLLFLIWVAVHLIGEIVNYIRGNRGRPSQLPRRATAVNLAFWKNGILGALFAVLVFLPLLRYMLDKPESFWYRAASRAQQSLTPVEAWHTFWRNVRNALLMFNYRGDVVPMNSVPEAPVLGPVIGALFILGLGIVVARLILRRDRTSAYVLTAFLTLLLPSILSLAYPGENPSVARTGGVIPVVMILAALPLAQMTQGIDKSGKRQVWVVVPFLVLALAGATIFNFDWYFEHYDANIRRSLWNATEIGATLRRFEAEGGQLQNAYHVAYPHWVDTRNIAINAGDITWHNAVTDLEQIPFHAQLPGEKLYLVHPSHQAALKVLREVYPQGTLRLQQTTRPGKEFLVFEVPAP